MAQTKKTTAGKTAAKAADTKTTEVKTVAAEANTEDAKKTVKKTTTRKTTVKKAPAKKEAAVETAAVQNEEAAKKEEVKVTVKLQFGGREISTEELVQNAKNVWQYDMNRNPEDFKIVELYVKPEEQTVYFVVNGSEQGCFSL